MSKKRRCNDIAELCPCGLDQTYAACCGRYHAGAAAPDAEALMRSRYAAYVRGLEAYLLTTWHVTTRPPDLALAASPQVKWLGLTVLSHTVLGDAATVAFVARCRSAGGATRMHEVSRFVRENGRWLYVDGDVG